MVGTLAGSGGVGGEEHDETDEDEDDGEDVEEVGQGESSAGGGKRNEHVERGDHVAGRGGAVMGGERETIPGPASVDDYHLFVESTFVDLPSRAAVMPSPTVFL